VEKFFLRQVRKPSKKTKKRKRIKIEIGTMKTSATILETNSMHSALATAGRSHEIPEALDAYGWLIGSWELELVGYDDEGNVMHTTGEASRPGE
jgi:hypothetical protein